MLKRFLKDLIFFLLTITVFTFSVCGDVLAIADYTQEANYSPVLGKDGIIRFNTEMPALKVLPYTNGVVPNALSKIGMKSIYEDGDASVEFTLACAINVLVPYITYLGVKNLLLKVINDGDEGKIASTALVYVGSLATLVAAWSIIYTKAHKLYRNLEICGANWLVWGNSGEGEGTSEESVDGLKSIIKFYPTLDAWPGSRKYEVQECFNDLKTCMQRCGSTVSCNEDFENAKKEAVADFNNRVASGLISSTTAMEEDSTYLAAIETAKNTKTSCLNINGCILDIDFMSKDNGRTYLTMNDKIYREKFYDGEEVYNKKCIDPREEAKYYDVNQDENGKPVESSKRYQHYYMRGYSYGNFACDRFKKDGDPKFETAYTCCLKASKQVCVTDKQGIKTEAELINKWKENKSKRREQLRKHVFCDTSDKTKFNTFHITSGGYECSVGQAALKVYKADSGEDSKYCVRTFNLCPYNFNIERGSELELPFKLDTKQTTTKENIDPNCTINCKQQEVTYLTVEDECFDTTNDTPFSCKNQIKNFYQHNRHCTLVKDYDEGELEFGNYPPFIDKSCINFVGSSHNTIEYKPYGGYRRNFDMYKSFTAPMAECFTETLKNFMFNRAGHTKCLSDYEMPSENEICQTGYEYKINDNLYEAKGIRTPTQRLLRALHSIIILVLTLMLTLYGYNIMIKGGELKREDMVMMMLKGVIVLVFSGNSWWYEQMYRFTYSFSNTFSMLTAKIGFDETQDIYGNYTKYDGCYFGNITDILGKNPGDHAPNIESNNYDLYPANRKYVAFFDSLDCKINKYLGYSVGKNVGSLITMLAASLLWPFNFGLYLAVGTLMILFFVINFAIKSVYIFIASTVAMTTMLVAAPIMIPCILFKKTKGIFDKWLKELISFALQPMVMFAYVGIALTIIDTYVTGDAIYNGSGINRNLVCGHSCVNDDTGVVIAYTANRKGNGKNMVSEKCEEGENNTMHDLKHRSALCLMQEMTTSNVSILMSLGIFIPSIINILSSDLIMILRVGFLFFILTRGVAGMPSVASHITGGTALPGTDVGDPFELARKFLDYSKIARRLAMGKDKAGDDDKPEEDKEDEENRQFGDGVVGRRSDVDSSSDDKVNSFSITSQDKIE